MRLAIKGDRKRGAEVVEILTTLGGKPSHLRLKGILNDHAYFINDNNKIDVFVKGIHEQSEFNVYALDEFHKHYPYKIGDVVRLNASPDREFEIVGMEWDEHQSEIWYETKTADGLTFTPASRTWLR